MKVLFIVILAIATSTGAGAQMENNVAGVRCKKSLLPKEDSAILVLLQPISKSSNAIEIRIEALYLPYEYNTTLIAYDSVSKTGVVSSTQRGFGGDTVYYKHAEGLSQAKFDSLFCQLKEVGFFRVKTAKTLSTKATYLPIYIVTYKIGGCFGTYRFAHSANYPKGSPKRYDNIIRLLRYILQDDDY